MKLLVTGGAGYIGSTTVSILKDNGYKPIVIDSLELGQRSFVDDIPFYHGDIADTTLIRKIFHEHPEIQDVIHFAARIDVEESVRKPTLYYNENLCKALTFYREVTRLGVQNFIFSSTAALYDASSQHQGLTEESRVNPQNPYAHSKLMFEQVLKDLSTEYQTSVLALRYFNPVGADPKLRSGPYRPDPSHLLGKLTKVAVAGGGQFTINGDDYDTRDGSPMRDFIHVWDLARAHLFALAFLRQQHSPTFQIVNVGSGQGVTVKEFVEAFLKVSPAPLKVGIGPRRPGDTAGAFADTTKAQQLLKWQPELTLEQGILDALRWEQTLEQS